MAVRYTDEEIAALLAEGKPVPQDRDRRMRLLAKRGHKERELAIQGANGSQFCLILRQSSYNALDFSVILAVLLEGSNQLFRLRRYDGKSHEHTNAIEGGRFYDFHVHTATQRYQERGEREDAYAEPCDRFADLEGALCCMLAECGFDLSDDPQLRMF